MSMILSVVAIIWAPILALALFACLVGLLNRKRNQLNDPSAALAKRERSWALSDDEQAPRPPISVLELTQEMAADRDYV